MIDGGGCQVVKYLVHLRKVFVFLNLLTPYEYLPTYLTLPYLTLP